MPNEQRDEFDSCFDKPQFGRHRGGRETDEVSAMPLIGIFAPVIGAGNMMLVGGTGLAAIALYFVANKKYAPCRK